MKAFKRGTHFDTGSRGIIISPASQTNIDERLGTQAVMKSAT